MSDQQPTKKLLKRPVSGGTHQGSRPHYFDYWRVGYGSREGYALGFWVEQAGEYHCKPEHAYPVDAYRIGEWTRVTYLAAGEALLDFEGNEMRVGTGDLVVVPPNHPYVYRSEQVSHYHWFALAGKWVSLWGERPGILQLSPGSDVELAAGFVAIRETLILQPPGYPLKAIGRLYDLMARLELLRSGSMQASSNYPDAVRNAMVFLQENYTQSFSAAETAAHVHVSQSYLRELFEKWVGESPKRYHTRRRIERARRLLRDQRLPVKVVAMQVGFNDVSNFSRVFKQMTGSSPGQYLKEVS